MKMKIMMMLTVIEMIILKLLFDVAILIRIMQEELLVPSRCDKYRMSISYHKKLTCYFIQLIIIKL